MLGGRGEGSLEQQGAGACIWTVRSESTVGCQEFGGLSGIKA
jgi:hypothetical protein